MSRGQDLAEGISILDDVAPSGMRKILHFAGETLVVEHWQDMEPILAHVQAMRERNEGRGWGEGREIGHIPDIFHRKIVEIQDTVERRKAVKRFFKTYPAFCAYPAYLKD
jgi:hypothetical protein